ncbi:unnamed protein product [Strongylus vulgaris]|uniref:Uncharacterized protein n=1 Tax=Strongylus vulgaris TaxID=40348 RepID=A0A3P7JV43_STRVU|nr:unnamed protein product [Strongylus vulgaris]
MAPSLFMALIVSSVLISAMTAPPKLVLEETPIVFGTIHGSPIIAVFHGQSDLIKEDVQGKDTEDDPLEKMGSVVA